MSLEAKIEALTQAVIALTAKMDSQPAPVAVAPTPVVAPVPVAAPPAPMVPPMPVPVAAITPVPVVPTMPAPPVFMAAPAPAPIAQPAGVPFSDGKGLIDYVMASYKTLGPQRGAEIQNVLISLGHQNINDVKPEQYGALFQGVEALKG